MNLNDLYSEEMEQISLRDLIGIVNHLGSEQAMSGYSMDDLQRVYDFTIRVSLLAETAIYLEALYKNEN